MGRGLGILGVAALAAGSAIAGTGCGGSVRAPKPDAGDLDVPNALGGTAGAGGVLGAGGATAIAGATGSGPGDVDGSTPRDTAGAGGGRGGATGGFGSGGLSGAGGGLPIDANADGGGTGAIDAVVIDPSQLCATWQTRAAAQDTLEVQQLALFESATVFEGTLGDFVASGDTAYAQVSVERVRTGIRPYEGLAAGIRIDRALYDQFGSGAKVIVGVGQTHPLVDKSPALPLWEQPQALLAATSAVPAELLGLHVWNTPNVAVVRVDELLDGGIRFTVVEGLRGDLPVLLQVPLSSYWPSLGVAVGSTWIAGFSDIIKTTGGAVPSASLLELRLDTPEERAGATAALQTLAPAGFATRYQAGLEQAQEDAIGLRLGWIYNQADLVAALAVTGIGSECCTNAGGLFHGSSVLDVLHGPAPAGQVLTGGHGYYAKKACGDRFLYALGTPVVLADGLGLECSGKTGVNEAPGSQVLHELPASADYLALARQWVASAPPLLRLYPAGGQLAPVAFAPPAGIALWSTPVSPLTAAMAGTPVVLTVVDVTKRAEGYAVKLRTPFYTSELSHLELRDVEVAFACADPRLLDVGSRYLGVVVGTDVVNANTVTAPLAQGSLFLAPGVLLPERSDLVHALRLLKPANLP